MDEIISAYANDELSDTQREYVEEHLSHCPHCRGTLAAYEKVKQSLVSLRDFSAPENLTETTMTKVKASTAENRSRNWRRLVLTAGAAVIILAILLVTQPWGIKSPEAMAASIVRNSPEVQAALNGEEIKEVEVTTKIVDGEGNVLMMLVKTEARAVVTRVNLETKQVTEIVRVNVPDFEPGDEQKAIDIAMADPRVQELLAQGGVVKEVHLGHSIDIAQVTGPDGVTRKEGTAKPTAFVFIDLKGKAWSVAVDLDEERVMGIGKPSAATLVASMSHLIFSIITPFVVAFGVLIILGLALRNRLAGKIAGVTSMVFGITGLYGGLYAFPGGRGEQFLALGIPVLGLVIGIAEIKSRANGRWAAITGVVLCSLALVLDTISIIAYPDRHIWVVITTVLILIGIIAYAFYGQIRKVPRNWLRPALVAGAAVIVLALVVIQPWSASPQSVIARAYSATENLQSYRLTSTLVSIFEGETSEQSSDWEFAFPDRYHGKITLDGETYEFIIIGEETYARDPDNASGKLFIGVWSGFAPSKEYTLEILDSLTGLQKLPDERIEGTDCLRYQGRVDVEQKIEELKARLDPEEAGYEERLKGLEALRTTKTEVELWIGKNDFLIRQMKSIRESSVHGDAVVVVKFYDFNEGITIESPTTASGELLPGWQLQSSLQNQQEWTFSIDVSFTISGDDPVHQQISYHITITNRDEEVAGDVRVKVLARATNDASGSIMIEAEPSTPAPVDLGPGESETYNVSWEYDASHTSKEELAKLVSYSRVFIRCTTVEGIEDVQVRSTDVVYPLKNPPTQELVAQYEQARQQADFPINVPTNLPRRLELSHVQAQGMPDGSQMLILTYGDPGAEHIKLSQRKFDVRMTEDEREHQRVFEEAGFSRFTIMNISGYWKEGVLCRTDINDKSTEYWDMSKTQMFWDEGDMTYHLTARDIPIEELMVFAASMIKID